MASEFDNATTGEWKPLLALDRDSWIGVLSGVLFVGDLDHAKRQIDVDSPTGLLPLLEWPFPDFQLRFEEVLGRADGSERAALTQISVAALIREGIRTGSDYWVGLALAWVEQAQSQEFDVDLRSIEQSDWASQAIRHRARHAARARAQRGG